jgi:Ni,Fe-hydrogenase III small subunit
MIFDMPRRSLRSPKMLIPVEELIGDARGSRLPSVQPASMTETIARQAVERCCTSALSLAEEEGHTILALDYGECVGCGNCLDAGDGAFFAAEKLGLCGVAKPSLIRRWDLTLGQELLPEPEPLDATAAKIRKLIGGALNIRQLDGGSCNGCEAEISALSNPYYDLARFGIHFVASPKHADMLLVTGPVTRNMAEAVRNTLEATPAPRLVVACGACGCNGGIFSGSAAVAGGVDAVIPVDAYIPGCPPTPAMLLTGILQALRRR